MEKLPRTENIVHRHEIHPIGSHQEWCCSVTLQKIRAYLQQFKNPNQTNPALDKLFVPVIETSMKNFLLPEPVRILSLDDVFKRDNLDIWNSSPGLPWKDFGYRTKRMIAADPDAVANVHKFWKLFSEGETMIASDCCLIGQSRTTESGQTQVGIMWEYPSTINFGEAIFAIPLIEAYRQLKSCPIADRYATPDGIRQLYQEAKRYEHFAQIEFEAFDQTVPNSLICMGMAILNMNINFDLYHDGSTAQKDRMKDMFVYLQNFFLMTRVRLCNGERYAKIGGISSGSYFTHMIRCITNYFVIQYLHIETSGQKAPFVRAFGSESIVASHKRIDSNRWMTLAEKIGMKINPDRSFISSQLTDLTFLGYPVKA